MYKLLFLWITFAIQSVAGLSIKGQLDSSPFNLTNYKNGNTYFKLQQIGDIENGHPIKAVAHLQDNEGSFEFDNIVLNSGINKTTAFVISPISKDFNLKPNRVLVEFFTHENGTIQRKGFMNYFGREYYPSKDIKFPETLEPIAIEPFVKFALVQKQPHRQYLQIRNTGILQSGPVAGILKSPWKMGLLIVAFAIILFPIYVENFDPETARLIKEEKQRKQREKYEAPK